VIWVVAGGVIAFVFVGFAILGVMTARWVEKSLGPMAKPAEITGVTGAPEAPDELVWWKRVGSDTEFQLQNGDTWRTGTGGHSWHRVQDGSNRLDVLTREQCRLLDSYYKLLEFKDEAMLSKCASGMKRWVPSDHGFKVTLVDGSEWEYSKKHRVWGQGSNNRTAWLPSTVANEEAASTLNKHLQTIEKQREAAQQMMNAALESGEVLPAFDFTSMTLDEMRKSNLLRCSGCNGINFVSEQGLCAGCKGALAQMRNVR
jgi:hypothetical protein